MNDDIMANRYEMYNSFIKFLWVCLPKGTQRVLYTHLCTFLFVFFFLHWTKSIQLNAHLYTHKGSEWWAASVMVQGAVRGLLP